jgi:TPR repeat protein
LANEENGHTVIIVKIILLLFCLIFLPYGYQGPVLAMDTYQQCVEYFEEKDFAKAYRVCQSSHDSNAQFLVAEMYFNGLGVKEDLTQAASWYRKAAEQGNCEAQFRIGHMHYHGVGVTKDQAAALTWFDKAAKNGHPRAREYRDRILNQNQNRR